MFWNGMQLFSNAHVGQEVHTMHCLCWNGNRGWGLGKWNEAKRISLTQLESWFVLDMVISCRQQQDPMLCPSRRHSRYGLCFDKQSFKRLVVIVDREFISIDMWMKPFQSPRPLTVLLSLPANNLFLPVIMPLKHTCDGSLSAINDM